MRQILLLFLFFVFLAGKLEAQQQQLHPTVSESSDVALDSAKAMNYCRLSGQYLALDQQKALMYGQKALQLAISSNRYAAKVCAYHAVGTAYMALADYKNAIHAHSSARELSAKAGDMAGIIQANIHSGNAYFKAKDHSRAIEQYLAAAGYAKQLNDKQQLSQIFALAGSVHENKGRYTEALNYYQRAAKEKEKLEDKRGLAVMLVQIGMVHIRMGQPEKALPYTLEALQLGSGPKSDTFRIAIMRNVAEAYKAMYNNSTALKYALQSYEMAVAAEVLPEVVASATLLQAIYADIQDFKQAYKYQAISSAQGLALEEENEKARIEALATAYEAEKKELELVVQQAEHERLLLEASEKVLMQTLAVLAALAVLSLLLLLLVYRRRLRVANWELQDAFQQLQARNYKIQQQHNELEQQAVVFHKQNDELERINNFKNKIFSVISHDLRGPFASVRGVLKLVQKKPMSEAGIKYLFGLLGKELDITLNMLNNLLVWSKSQLEHSEIVFKPVDMQLLAKENLQLANSQAKHKNISIVNMVEEGMLVLADKERVNFVLRNLIMNAIKFTFDGGEIKVSAKEIGDTITIEVSDNGKGISEENLAKLFSEERFTTLGTSSEKGTGLGLMLCKEFIESMNGRIGVESEEGKGSTFYFTLQKAAMESSENEDVHTLMLA